MAWVVSAVSAAISIGTVAAVATAVAEVGLALTVVGTVTKSKELTSIGKVMSVAGGVVSLGAGLASMATGAAAEGAGAAAAGTAGESAASNALTDATSQALSNQAVETGTSAVADQVTGAGLAELSPNLAQNAGYGIDGLSGAAADAAGSNGLVNGALSQGGGTVSNFAPAAPLTSEEAISQAVTPQFATNTEAAGFTPSFGANQATSVGNSLQSASVGGPMQINEMSKSAMVSQPGMFESASKWFDSQSPAVKSALIQGGLGALGGLSNSWQAEKRLELERKIADERIKTEQAQRANANAIPSIKFQPIGLVNRAIGG